MRLLGTPSFNLTRENTLLGISILVNAVRLMHTMSADVWKKIEISLVGRWSAPFCVEYFSLKPSRGVFCFDASGTPQCKNPTSAFDAAEHECTRFTSWKWSAIMTQRRISRRRKHRCVAGTKYSSQCNKKVSNVSPDTKVVPTILSSFVPCRGLMVSAKEGRDAWSLPTCSENPAAVARQLANTGKRQRFLVLQKLLNPFIFQA